MIAPGKLVIALFLLAAAGPNVQPPPGQEDELAPLREKLADEPAFVEAVRSFDRVHVHLAEADALMGSKLRENGQEEAAKERFDSARAHVELVRKAYAFALKHYPNNARLHNFYGELLLDYFKDPSAAAKEWNTALMLDDELAAAHNNLGMYLLHGGRYSEGLRHMERALDLDDENPDFLFNMAQIYLIHGPQVQARHDWSERKVYKEAMEMSKKAAKLAPEDFDILQDYAVNFFAAENFGVDAKWKHAARAWEDAREHARNDTERFYTWLNEARAWIRKGDEEEAGRCLLKALELRPQSDVAKRLLEGLELDGQGFETP